MVEQAIEDHLLPNQNKREQQIKDCYFENEVHRG